VRLRVAGRHRPDNDAMRSDQLTSTDLHFRENPKQKQGTLTTQLIGENAQLRFARAQMLTAKVA